MSYLVDVNVWVALALEGHAHHEPARRWFDATGSDITGDDRSFFCRTTQQGLFRLLTNPTVMKENVLTADQAWNVYAAFLSDSRVGFAHEPPGLEDRWRRTTRGRRTGSNFWTDSYLAAFAATAGYTVVSFDRAFQSMRGVASHLLGSSGL